MTSYVFYIFIDEDNDIISLIENSFWHFEK